MGDVFIISRKSWQAAVKQTPMSGHFTLPRGSAKLWIAARMQCHKVLVGDFKHILQYIICVFLFMSLDIYPAHNAFWGDNHSDFSIVVVLKLKSMRSAIAPPEPFYLRLLAYLKSATLPENGSPENRPLERDIPIGNHHF